MAISANYYFLLSFSRLTRESKKKVDIRVKPEYDNNEKCHHERKRGNLGKLLFSSVILALDARIQEKSGYSGQARI